MTPPRTAAQLLADCRQAWYGPCWHGPSLRFALSGVKTDAAFSVPLPGAHRIAEITLHIAAWNEVVARQIEGKTTVLTPQKNFPASEDQSDASWKAALKRLRSSQEMLLAGLKTLRPAEFARRVPGHKFDLGFMIAGASHHALYHAGQISMLKKAVLRQAGAL